jgi:MinD-like ATPase involved in chromosome partitioning or flagellar assembly
MPVDQIMTVPNLSRFMNHTMPEIKREIVKKDKRRMLKVANMQIDVIGEINSLYEGAKEKLKEDLNAKEYKAISSEMRELLKQILELQKEVLSYENVKKFMDIVLNTVREECPEALPTILERLRVHQNTGWFGEQQTEEQKQEG